MFGVHQLPCCCAWIYFYFLNTIVLSYFFFIKCMNLSDVTIASSAWPMSSPPKRHYISFIWYVHVEFLLAKKILTELLFILAFMFIYSRVFGWNSLFWICTICTSRRKMYFTKYMYIDVFTILLLSNEYEGRVFTIYLWKSLFLPLFLRRKCRERSGLIMIQHMRARTCTAH